MGQAIAAVKGAAAIPPAPAGVDLELVEKGRLVELEEALENVQEQYQEALVILRAVKAKANRAAKSGNPGRRNAGLEILELLP